MVNIQQRQMIAIDMSESHFCLIRLLFHLIGPHKTLRDFKRSKEKTRREKWTQQNEFAHKVVNGRWNFVKKIQSKSHSHVRQINKGLPNNESRDHGIVVEVIKLEIISNENCFSPDSIAVMDRISLEQLCEHDAMSILPSCGSNGNSDITEPKSVKFPSSSRAAR